MTSATPDFERIIRVLTTHDAEFIAVPSVTPDEIEDDIHVPRERKPPPSHRSINAQ